MFPEAASRFPGEVSAFTVTIRRARPLTAHGEQHEKDDLDGITGPSFPALADTYVQGYTKQDGTYVQPHYRTNANNTKLDNYSTQGNVNPYTGQEGTKSPYGSSSSQYSTPCYGYNCDKKD